MGIGGTVLAAKVHVGTIVRKIGIRLLCRLLTALLIITLSPVLIAPLVIALLVLELLNKPLLALDCFEQFIPLLDDLSQLTGFMQ